MKKLLLNVLAASALLFAIGCSSSNTDANTAISTGTETVIASDSATAASTDQATGATSTQPLDSTSFPILAASSDMFELLSSQEAQKRGTHAEVKAFAQQMITDHTKTSAELKTIAGGKNILLPAAPLPMHQRMLHGISTETKEFDEEYMEAQVMAHRLAVSLFETASKSQADPDLRNFAAKHLPHLKMHLEKAKKTKDLVD